MKSFLSLSILWISVSLIFSGTVSARDNETTSQSGTITLSGSINSLLIEKIETIDTNHVNIQFNQDIIEESVRVRITKQSDESNVRIGSLTGGIDTKTIRTILNEPLIAGTSYKITIVSAISDSGVIIRDGADGIKEFTTPDDLMVWMAALNAPTNPNAIKVLSGITSTGEIHTQITQTPSGSISAETQLEKIKELPISGTNTILLIILAGAIAGILLIKRRNA